MRRLLLIGGLGLLGGAYSVLGLELTRSRFTEVVNEVSIITEGSGPKKRAEINDLFKVPDILQTGPRSRAELRAEDQTITRVGANTVFSFESKGRTIRLQKGSILFHSPTGRGGGTIKTGSATASVLGTTITVVTTKEGGFKLLVQEGKAKVELPNGMNQVVNAGELVFILPHVDRISPPIPFDLERQVDQSKLLRGFSKPLASVKKIDRAVSQQNRQVKRGRAEKTSLLIADMDGQDKLHLIDNNTEAQTTDNTPASSLLPQDAEAILSGLSDADKRKALAKYLFGLDAEINTPSLDPSHIVNLKGYTELEQGWTHNNDLVWGFSGGRRYAFLAKNILFDSEDIDVLAETQAAYEGKGGSNGLRSSKDLSLSSFYFLAQGDVTFQDQVSFKNAPPYLFILSKGKLETKAGTTIKVSPSESMGYLTLSSLGSQTYQDTSIEATDIHLTSQDLISLSGTHLNGETTVFIEASSIMSDNRERSTITGQYAALVADNDIILKTLGFNANDVMLSARTVVLEEVYFSGGSRVNLFSASGKLAPNPNTGQAVVPGDVNFINQVLYNNQPAEQNVGNQIQINKR